MLKSNLKRYAVISLMTALICTGIILICIIFPSPRKTMPSWSETKAKAGEIEKMLYKYAEVKGKEGSYPPSWQELLEVNKSESEADELFKDRYFKKECYSWEASYDESLNPPVRFKITFTVPKGCEAEHIRRYKKTTYDHNGVFKMYK